MIGFEPFRREHLPLLRDWLSREHLRRWWGDESLGHAEDALAGRDASAYYLIVVDGRAVGMVQTYLVSDYPEWEAVVGPGKGLAGVDLLIGEKDATGRGLGPQVLEQFTREVVLAARRRRRAWPRSRRRIAARGGRSRRPASGTCATSRKTAFRTD